MNENNLHILGIDENGNFSDKAQLILNNIGDNCLDLLLLKYVENLSYEEIAIRKNKKIATAKQTVWRCKQTFLEKWQEQNNFN